MYAVRTWYANGPIVTRWFHALEAAKRYAAHQKVAVVYDPSGQVVE